MPQNFSGRYAIHAQAWRRRYLAKRGCRARWKVRAQEFSLRGISSLKAGRGSKIIADVSTLGHARETSRVLRGTKEAWLCMMYLSSLWGLDGIKDLKPQRRKRWAIVRENDRPLIFRCYLEQNPLRLFRDEFREAFCPFDHRDAIAVKVSIEAKSRDGLSIFHAKKIEVIHRHSPSSIFMQDGEGGTRHIDAATQPGDESFDEQRFTAS